MKRPQAAVVAATHRFGSAARGIRRGMRLPLLLFVLLLTLSCARKAIEPKYIFLLTLDTTRADAVNLTPGNSDTPHLAALAARGRTWSQAFALTPITLPSHLNMLYSLPPHRLKVYNNGQIQEIPHPSLSQLLKSKGYHGAAAISLGVLKKDFGTAKGFDSYAENFRPNLWYRTAAEVNRDAFAALERFRNRKTFFWFHYSDPHEPYYPPRFSEKFRILLDGREIHSHLSTDQPRVQVDFMAPPGKTRLTLETEIPREFQGPGETRVRFISYQDFLLTPETGAAEMIGLKIPSHWRRTRNKRQANYLASRFRSPLEITNSDSEPRRVRVSFIYRMLEHPDSRPGLYREQVHYMDSQIGLLLKKIREHGMMDDAVFLVIGDHGEGLGEYRRHYGHIHYLNPVYTRVPLILAGKGIASAPPSADPVSTLDVAPTLLRVAGCPVPEFMDGLSLLDPIPFRRIILETYSPEAYFDAFSIVNAPWQIIHYPGHSDDKIELIQMQNDPLGIDNRFEDCPDPKMKSELYNAVLKLSRALIASKGRPGKIDPRHEEMLKSLGYL
ncbi:MAG: sulfatase-like hydrolase/transferase [Acidobacteriota bacterium]|jgi:arylsulfatase A-like enzyme|nr:sulfatase-like hydrolase/transferase [Acidobacteriota bacterium]